MQCAKCHAQCKTCQGATDNDCLSCDDTALLVGTRCLAKQALATQAEFVTDPQGEVTEKCGKGYRLSKTIECDDGNLIDGDGCDAQCKVESGYECTGGGPKTIDSCANVVELDFQVILRDPLDSLYDFLIEFNKALSQESLTTIQESFGVSLDKINQTQYKYSLTKYNNSADQQNIGLTSGNKPTL